MRLGRYTLVKRVGTGGMAEVWKAVFRGPEGFEKHVAIKRVLPHLAADREFVEMFISEAKLAAKLVHPNITQVFDFGVVEGEGEYFLALEYVAGDNVAAIRSRLRDKAQTLPASLALHIASEAAKALAFAHSMDIVHSDVSPHNLLVSWNGEVKVADFGIARVGVGHAQSDGILRGKVSYFSPEQATGARLDARSDIFSLGLVLFEMITGERLFRGETSDEVVKKISAFTGLAKDDLARLPEGIRELMSKILAPAPADRFQDALSLETSLTVLLGPGGSTAARTELAALLGSAFAEERRADENERAPTDAVEYITGEVPVVPRPASLAGGWDDRTDAPTRVVKRTTNPSVTIVSPARDVQPDKPTAEKISPPLVPPPTAAEAMVPVATAPKAPPAETDRATISGLPSMRSLPSVHGKPTLGGAFQNAGARKGILFAGAAVLLVVVTASWRILFYSPSADSTPAPTGIAAASPSITVVAIASDVETPTAPPPIESATVPVATATASAAVRSTPKVKPTPTPKPTPTAKARPSARVKPTPTPKAAAADAGWLTVLADPWVEVWINGKRVAAETPLRRYPLAAGKYTLKVVNGAAGYKAEQALEIESGGESRLFVDVAQKKIRVDR